MAFTFGKVENNLASSTRNYAPAVKMDITAAPTELITKFLTDIYASPLQAAIRELISNAIDANKRAGKGIDEIDVEIESVDTERGFRHYFRVSDKGAGMTREVLTKIYTQYGMSLKREDDDATGAFGLGAKSPLAYTKEFHVLSRTVEDGAQFMTAYRTSEGMFLADEPLPMTTRTMDVEYNRDYKGCIIAPVMDEDGNIVRPNAYNTTKMMVADRFDEGETGCCVWFPINSSDVDGAHSILNGIKTLYAKTTGEKFAGDESEIEKSEFFFVGDCNLEDENGNSVNAGVYLNTTRLIEITNALIYKRDCLTTQSVDFKVSNWLYPADGTAWSTSSSFSAYSRTGIYDMKVRRAIIVDLPSCALPFVPSRDTIRTDNNNENANKLVAQVGKFITDYLLTGDGLTAFCAAAIETSGYETPDRIANCVFSESVVDESKLSQGKLAGTIEIGFRNAANRPKATIEVDLNELKFAGYSVVDLAKTQPAVFGTVQYNRHGDSGTTKNMGMYIVNDAVSPKMLNRFSDVNNRSSYRGYDRAKSKVVADSVVACGYTAPSDIRYDGRGDGILPRVAATPCYPAGCAMMYIGSSSMHFNTPFVIIDASKVGVKKVRPSIARIFDNNNVMSKETSTTGFYAIIPPKTEGAENWTADEVQAQVDFLTDIAENMGLEHVVYIPANKIKSSSALPTTGNGKSQNSELQKMFRHKGVLQANRDAVMYANEGFSASASYYSDVLEQIVANPTEWGLFVVNGGRRRGYQVGVEYAKAAFALGLVPSGISNVVCVNAANYNEKRAKMMEALGVTVLYDNSGKTSVPAVIPASAFNDCGSYGIRVEYTGDVPDVCYAIENYDNLTARDKRVLTTINSNMPFVSFMWIQPKPGILSTLVDAISFGNEQYVEFDGNIEIGSWRRNVLTEITFSNKERKDYAAGNETAIADIVRIWKHYCSKIGMEIRATRFIEHLHEYEDIAKALGIDKAIEAYESGVPLDDILA